VRILSGIQSSGWLHLGNYYGALRQFVELQRQAQALYFIANLADESSSVVGNHLASPAY
jgi:tryptophanyl-tRNA synthetase